MKKIILSILLLFIAGGSVFAQTDWTNKRRLLPDKLRGLAVGILISHDPNPCYPEKIDGIYYWKHHTRATATVADLTVVECGSYIWYDESGWHANMHYIPVEFAEKFACAQAILKRNKTYTYQKNWRLGNQPYGGDALWYIIAKDKNGKLYKGSALIETEDNVLTIKP